MRYPHVPLSLLLFLSACELTEVVVAPGQRVVVVQSVINRTATQQFVVVEYSQTGDVHAGFTDRWIPSGSPRQPVSGAWVTIEHVSGAGCAGRVDTLTEQPPAEGRSASGTYGGAICLPEPGARLTLRVETPAGEVITGSTTVPGASARDVRLVPGAAAPGGDTLVLDRERDTLEIGVTPTSGRALQVELRRAEDHDDLAIYLFSDSMGIRFPGNVVNPFEGDSGESVFRAGRYHVLSVAMADTNFYDFLRSRSDPFTGRGFINHLTGGIGVFGSAEAATRVLRVVAPVDDPREGVYQVTGSANGVDLDVTMELYVDEVEHDRIAAFVRGNWIGGPIDLSGDGWLDQTGSGSLELHLDVLWPGPTPGPRYVLSGTRANNGAPFPLDLVGYIPGIRDPLTATLTARQISGPAASPIR